MVCCSWSLGFALVKLSNCVSILILSSLLVCVPCQTMPVAMALLRDVQNLCPKDVLNFILDLIKYNDNRKNKVKTHIHTHTIAPTK